MTPRAGALKHAVPPRQPTRRAAKRERLRAVVEHTALELFRAQGFDEVTVERIAAEAGVGPTTFYRYFGTKDGVLFDYQERWLQVLRDVVATLDVSRPRPQQLHDLLVALVTFFDTELETMRLRDEIMAASPTLLPRALAVQRAWEHELAQSLAQQRRADAGDVTVQLDAALVQVVVRVAFRQWRAGAVTSLTAAVSTAWEAAEAAFTGNASIAS